MSSFIQIGYIQKRNEILSDFRQHYCIVIDSHLCLLFGYNLTDINKSSVEIYGIESPQY